MLIRIERRQQDSVARKGSSYGCKAGSLLIRAIEVEAMGKHV